MGKKIFNRLANCAFAALVLLHTCAYGQSSLSLGPLNRFVEPSVDESWTVTHEGDAAVLENTRDPGSINYFYVDSEPQSLGKRVITLDVGFYFSNLESLAGLMYGFTQEPYGYYLFTIGGDQTANLHRFSNNSFEQVLKSSVDGLHPDKTTLKIEESGNSIKLFVNNTEVSSLSNNSIGKGGVGVAAAGIGKFSYRNFSVDTVKKRIQVLVPNRAARLKVLEAKRSQTHPEKLQLKLRIKL